MPPLEHELDIQQLRASAEAAGQLLKALANPERLLLLCQLSQGERNVSELEALLGIQQPTLSQQLGVLRDEGLVSFERDGQTLNYRIADRRVGKLLKFGHKILSHKQQMAVTCALEHFTAIIANRLLTDTDIMNNLSDEMRPIWMWHAIEETEHKAVAFDLYQNVPGSSYTERVVFQVLASVILAAVVAAFQVQFMYRDKQLFNLKSWAFGLNKLLGRNGVVSGLWSEYLDFFKPGFHPWDHENSALVAYWRERLDGAVATRAA